MTAPAPPAPSRVLWRLRLTVCCAALAALAFLQQPGRIVADSKLDLAVDPIGFLLRAGRMWEPQGFFGQIQNQAYGYAWPAGPFFALGDLVGLDAWVVQRLWLTALLVGAFLGVVRLAGALSIGTPTARLVAGFAFALTPRLMTTLGPISVEALPTCVAPWVLLPLVRAGAGRLGPRRAAALSGLAFTFAGGVNAVAAIAALVVPALFVLTRPRGPRGRLAGWWTLAIALASMWWVVPLLLLGRYSPPFIDYIETAVATTGPTSLTEVLRGTSHWVAHLSIDARPVWPAGWTLAHLPALVLYTAVVAGLGLAGLARRGVPERRWLVLCVVTGVALVSLGHTGALAPPWAAGARELLDGPLAPFRNLHKFDVVLRLPLVLGLCALLALVPGRPWPGRAALGVQARRLVAVVAVLGIAGGAAPALGGGLHPPGAFESVPGYWAQTARWLERNADDGRALLVPGARFGDYLWGRTRDEPLQPLAASPWAVRDAVPLTPPGTIRLLDAVQERLASGRGSTALADVLARAGVAYVVVRNDLDPAVSRSVRPVLVHAALAASPGLERVAAFGPPIGAPEIPGTFVDEGLEFPYRAVEVYAVGRTVDRVSLTTAGAAVLASGGPESLVALLERGWARGRPVVFTGDADPGTVAHLRRGAAPAVVTDGLRRREVSPGRLDGNASATLTRDDPLRVRGPARDYLPWDGDALTTAAVLSGARRVSASSSASDPAGLRPAEPARQPYSAVDGDPGTAWRPRADVPARGQWWELDLGRSVPLAGARVRAEAGAGGRAEVHVDGHRVGSAVLSGGTWTALPPRSSGRVLRLTLTGAPRDGAAAGLAEVSIPGVVVRRPLRTPPVEGLPGAAAVALDAAGDGRTGCVDVAERTLCAAALAARGEEDAGLDREVVLGEGGRYRFAASAVPRPGAALDALLATPGRGATASSAEVAAPLAGAEAAFDGDVRTAWVAADGDRRPELTLRWSGPRVVRGIRLLLDPAVAASRARRVEVVAGGSVFRVTVDRTGRAEIPATRTEQLTLVVRAASPVRSIDPPTAGISVRPVGVSEVRLVTDRPLPAPVPDTRSVEIPCGGGPDLVVGERTVRTSATATRRAFRTLATVPLRICDDASVDLPAGTHRVGAESSGSLRGTALTLTPVDRRVEAPAAALGVRISRWDAENRVVGVEDRTRPSLLAVAENTNPGWVATLRGERLRPVVVDGWRQGWWLPAGRGGEVVLSYAPGRLYRAGLVAGALALLGLLALAVARPRDTAPGRGRRVAAPAGRGVAGIAGAVLVAATGLPGVVGLGVALALRAVLPATRVHAVLGATAGVAYLVAGVLSAAGRVGWVQGAGSSGGTAACVFALSCLVAAVVGRSGTSDRSRSAGRSSSR